MTFFSLFYYINMTLDIIESIIDNDKTVADKLDQAVIELKSKIRSWMVDHVRISTRSNFFYSINPRDFDVDDDLLISVKEHVEEVSIYGCLDIPTYIRFKYVGKEFKISHCNVESGDASFLLKNLSREGKKTVDEVFISDTNFKSIGDWSKINLWLFAVENNKNLKMKVSELPKVDVSLQYTGNGNEFKLSDVRSRLKYPDMTVVRLDHAIQNVRESIVDSDSDIRNKVLDKSYYIALLAKKLVETYKKTFDLKELYTADHFEYVYLNPKDNLSNDLKRILKLNRDDKIKQKAVKEVLGPLIVKLFIEGVTSNAKIEQILYVQNQWFTTLKIGDVKLFNDPEYKNYIYPSIGIHLFRDFGPMMCLDLGEEKYNKELFEYIKQYR